MITVVLLTAIPGRHNPDFKTLHIFPGDFLFEPELIGAFIQMHLIARRLYLFHPDLNFRIRLIAALHSHRHGIQIALIQIARHLHILHIDILRDVRPLIDAGQKFHLSGQQRRGHAAQIPRGLFAVCQDNDPTCPICRDHR